MHRLSQIITVHKSEWAVAWDEVRKAKETRGQSFGDYRPGLTAAGKKGGQREEGRGGAGQGGQGPARRLPVGGQTS